MQKSHTCNVKEPLLQGKTYPFASQNLCFCKASVKNNLLIGFKTAIFEKFPAYPFYARKSQ